MTRLLRAAWLGLIILMALVAITFLGFGFVSAVLGLFGPETEVVEPRCRVIECAGQAVKP